MGQLLRVGTVLQRIAITGGLGLQGSRLATRLMLLGHYVKVFDNGQRGRNQGGYDEWENIDLRFNQPDFHTFDTVYHLAAHVGGVEYTHRGHDNQMMLDNMQIDVNVFRAAAECKVRKVILASTACVYPVSKQTEWNSILEEDDAYDPVEPESGYGWAKLCAEILLQKMNQANEIPRISILRPFNVYGPGEDFMPGSHVIPELLRKVLFEKTILVYGSGRQGRCFLYVDDMVEAYVRSLDVDFAKPINIGTQDAIRIAWLAQKMCELADVIKPLEFDTGKPTGVMGRVPDLTRAKAILKWKPRTPLDVGLRTTMDWMRMQRRIAA